MASEAEERGQLLLPERPRPLAVQDHRTEALAAAGRAARPNLVCHWHPAGQDRLECRWTSKSIAATSALRIAGDNDQTNAEARTDSVRASGPAPQERHSGTGRVVDFPLKHDRKIEDELYRRLRRQDALVFAIGLLLLAVAAGAIYLYWDYARPFVATDDPFLAARQFPIAVRTVATPSQHRLTLDNERPGAPTNKTVGRRSSRSEAPQPTPDPAVPAERLVEKIFAPASPERRGLRMTAPKVARLRG
jgi:hypothetical protein